MKGDWHTPCAKEPSILGGDRFRFLNEERTLRFPESWNASGPSKLWLYNLHYFDDLNAEDATKRAAAHAHLMQRWIDDNPPPLGNGWEPYPLSLRIVNWMKWALAGNRLTAQATQSLAVQVRQLSRSMEYHLLGNHLFENAKALVFAGLFFSGPESERWLAQGRRVLNRQIDEQILEDGGHFELSPMYHALILEGMLDLLNLHGAFGSAVPPAWPNLIGRMMGWLRALTHPDGDFAFFNDAAIGIAPSLTELERYASTLGLYYDSESPAGTSRLLPESGYARLQNHDATVLADVAAIGPDYLPGHAHADSLSFELSLYRRRILVNSGTSVYGVGDERLRQRGTAAHNTVRIDEIDSSEVWSGFRVARRARVSVEQFAASAPTSLCAFHNGYRHLEGHPVHRRTWVLGEKSLTLTDDIMGQGNHCVEVFLHFHPSLCLERLEDGGISVRTEDGEALLTISPAPNMAWTVERGTWHPRFGVSLPNAMLRGRYRGDIPASFATRFEWTR